MVSPRYIVTCVEPVDDHWQARVSLNGTTRLFHDRYGSWQTDRRPRADGDWPANVERREALPEVARVLQTRVGRKAKRREQDARLFEPTPEPMTGQLGMAAGEGWDG
jgi:hypothetical protein